MSTRTDLQMVINDLMANNATAAMILDAVVESEFYEDALDEKYNLGYDNGYESRANDEDY